MATRITAATNHWLAISNESDTKPKTNTETIKVIGAAGFAARFAVGIRNTRIIVPRLRHQSMAKHCNA